MPPKDDDIARLNDLFEELRKVVGSILDWKSKISGGMTVMVWVIGVVQSVVLLCLGFAANALNHTAETLGTHAVELATAKAEIKAYMAEGRLSADKNAASEAALKDYIQQWAREEFERKHP